MAFFKKYKAQITLYENALSELKKSYSKLQNSKDIWDRFEKLNKKRIPLCKCILSQNHNGRALQDTQILWNPYG